MFKNLHIPSKFILIILTLVSAAFIIVGIVGSVSTDNFTGKAEKTYAKVTDIDSQRDIIATSKRHKTKYVVYVDFMVNGVTYSRVKLGTYNSPMGLGEHIEIYYDPDDPNRISDGKKSSNYVSICTGVIMFIVAIFVFIKKRKEETEDLE
ncbi:MAG: DUF3592 domain-containing protein [Ruminococcaceae bacterium]|nr:DUF3592 domain-containing protein [Oscillospiraceae bacterium]